MIVMPVHALWVLLGIWLAVTLCAFMFGWYARAYSKAERAELERAVRRPPSTRFQPDHLSRPGRFTGPTSLLQEPDPGRWWPALERTAPPETTPLSQVELSNWEKNNKRKMDAWLHERGMR